MTEPGRHTNGTTRRPSRWSVAALLAPASAAVFAGTMGWAVDNQPSFASTNASVGQQGNQDGDHGERGQVPDAALQRQIQAQIAQVKAMRKQVAVMRKQVAKLTGGTVPAPASSKTSTQAPAPSKTTTQAPAPTATTQAPAPATSTTTGGS